MEKFLNQSISMPEFFAQLRIKNYPIIDSVAFLEKHRILLSVDKKSLKFAELLEDITDELEGDLSYTGDEFENGQVLVVKMKDKKFWIAKGYCKKSKIFYNIFPVLEENIFQFLISNILRLFRTKVILAVLNSSLKLYQDPMHLLVNGDKKLSL